MIHGDPNLLTSLRALKFQRRLQAPKALKIPKGLVGPNAHNKRIRPTTCATKKAKVSAEVALEVVKTKGPPKNKGELLNMSR